MQNAARYFKPSAIVGLYSLAFPGPADIFRLMHDDLNAIQACANSSAAARSPPWKPTRAQLFRRRSRLPVYT